MLIFAGTLIILLFVWYIGLPLCTIVFQYTLGRRLYSKREQLKRAGEWAVITGATDGIGKAFAEELASDGLSIMIISRNQERLDNVAEHLRSKYNVSVKCVAADLSQVDIYESLEKEIRALPSIACLVNNVGMYSMDDFAFGDSMNVENIQKNIFLNCLSVASMTQIILPRLTAQNSGSAVINVSSYAGKQPLPYLSLYGATKAFVRHLSISLEVELKEKNVLIQTLCPMYVNTKLANRDPGFFIITPEMCAKSSLNMLGMESECTGHWIHALEVWFYGITPQFLVNGAMRKDFEKYSKES